MLSLTKLNNQPLFLLFNLESMVALLCMSAQQNAFLLIYFLTVMKFVLKQNLITSSITAFGTM